MKLRTRDEVKNVGGFFRQIKLRYFKMYLNLKHIPIYKHEKNFSCILTLANRLFTK